MFAEEIKWGGAKKKGTWIGRGVFFCSGKFLGAVGYRKQLKEGTIVANWRCVEGTEIVGWKIGTGWRHSGAKGGFLRRVACCGFLVNAGGAEMFVRLVGIRRERG